MIQYEVQIRVRYAETDKMGYVYYGNYATYLEVARVETFRFLDLSYKELEDKGVMMPVLDYKTKFIRPAKYDDLLTVKVKIKEKPGVRVSFEYETYNQDNILLNVAETTLVFVDLQTGKPCLPPEYFSNRINSFFSKESLIADGKKEKVD